MMNKLYEYINFCKFKVEEEPNWNAEFYIKYVHDFHNENQKYLYYGEEKAFFGSFPQKICRVFFQASLTLYCPPPGNIP